MSQRLPDAPLAAPWVTVKSTLPPDQTTVIAPVRIASAFAATKYGIVAPLRPEVNPVRVIHGVVVDALKEQPFGVLRVATKVKFPPALPAICDDGVRVYVQVDMPSCVIVTAVDPPGYVTVSVPARTVASGFGAAVNAMAADAAPDVGNVIVSHAASTDAVHAQPDPVTESAALDAPPSAGTVCDADAKL
jgi:hypothetical protein